MDETEKTGLTTQGRVRIVSLDVDLCSATSIADKVEKMVLERQGGYICFSTVHMVMEGFDDPEFAILVNSANLVIPDGMPLVWMQKLLGHKQAERTRANDMMTRLCEVAASKGWSVGFYGASEDVISGILDRLSTEFPSLTVSYAFSPPFRPPTSNEEAKIIQEIESARPALLFVGLGCPKQERWMSRNAQRLSCVMFGVGASFDFFAGNVKEAPRWLSRIGLEWLFRLWKEPKRLWRRYLIQNPRFVFQAFLQIVGAKKQP
ncbi:WecB/TagA/CpsF family glycosyltransferase [Leptolyngbya sp. 7M]|uniref:WecB/TagA/CpsF family glycosyltransferase n=1 Tax=Leptolyngbya sp. 7M TaxID=2812896 RepID=UPI001B8D0F33|nr:WecB/TagA/CpsF family glycosyltransferase [Leptolyngbya sp. 7M]QYO66374.1 WecB/TagA/CpsF family glycosyltransferase [Leptolyngbya sp. 7M]